MCTLVSPRTGQFTPPPALWYYLIARLKGRFRHVSKGYTASLHTVARVCESQRLTLLQMLQNGKQICGFLSLEFIRYSQYTLIVKHVAEHNIASLLQQMTKLE